MMDKGERGSKVDIVGGWANVGWSLGCPHLMSVLLCCFNLVMLSDDWEAHQGQELSVVYLPTYL